MSDTTNSNTQLDAGTPPAQPALQDAIARSKALSEKGHANDQNTLSFARGPEAEAARPTVAKPVDFRSIAGSYAGDHRAPSSDTAKDSLNQAAGVNRGPRDGQGQFPLGSKSPNNLPVSNWAGNQDDSDSGV
jgi:hypothetical protein